MQKFEEYRKYRLDLGDSIRSLLYLARARHDDALEAACRGLLKRLAEDRFTVAIVGQHSRGKTTLMNALLGGEYLPTGILPMTSVITVVRYGSRPRASYFRRGSNVALHVEIAEVPALVARESATRAKLQVERVEIEVPAELLRLGLTFVDTPGVGSADDAGAAATHGFLPDADAVVFVTSVDSALTESELTLLREAPRSAPVFCVVNKVDLASPGEVASVVSFVGRVLRESTARDTARVVPLSALSGLRRRLSPLGQRSDGGVDAFQQLLETVLMSVRTHVALSTSLDRAWEIHDDAKRMLDLADHFARLSSSAQASLRAELSAADANAAAERDRVVVRMGDEAQHVLDIEVSTSRDEWYAALVAAADARGEADASPGSGVTRVDRPGSPAWWSATTARLSESAAGAAFRYARELGATLDAPVRAALASASLAVPESARTRWQSRELPGFAPPRLVTNADSTSLSSGTTGRSRRRLGREVDRLLDAFDDHLRQQNLHRTEWIAHDAGRQAAATTERLERYLAAPPTEVELDAMARIRTRLDDIGAALAAHPLEPPNRPATLRPATSTTGSSPGGREPQPRRRNVPFDCMVCHRQRDALIEDVRHRQLLIATRERDQAEFARIGGLCAQHTWIYASFASPVGIASAYAPLASGAAESLVGGHSPDDLLSTAAGFGGDTANCPVCHTVARAEAEALRDLERFEGTAPPICLRHLGAAAASGLSSETLLALARTLAEALRRHADDMRAYTLKREALAGGFLTLEEDNAYKETLLLIAGDPLLAGPATLPLDVLHADVRREAQDRAQAGRASDAPATEAPAIEEAGT